MASSQITVDYVIPPGVTNFTSFFDPSQFKLIKDAHGGFADIYTNTLGKQKYAIKLLRRFDENDEARMKKDFNLELRAWLKVGSHDNILEFVGYCFMLGHGGQRQPCLLSHWQENGQLDNYLKGNPGIDLLEILQGVAAGLRHMHTRDVIHGDIQGANILVSRDGVPRLADFGLSKLCGREASASVGSGTVRWMAKEVICAGSLSSVEEKGSRRSKASDIWSMGMTILELLSGQKPYSKYLSHPPVILAIARGEKPAFPGILHNGWIAYKDGLLEICERCWQDEPSERPAIQQLHDQIRNFRSLRSIQEDSELESLSLTSYTRDKRNHSEILERVEYLGLSRSDGTSSGITANATTSSRSPGEESRSNSSDTSGSSSMSTFSIGASSDLGVTVKDKTSSDACKISYMTAFINHLMASKRLREHTILSESEGPDHAPTWYVTISIDEVVHGKAFGPSKELAQEEAAKQAFEAIEDEEIARDIPYLPIFVNRLNVRGSHLHSQFRWHSDPPSTQNGDWLSILYWNGIEVGTGKGNSQDRAKGEAARAAALRF